MSEPFIGEIRMTAITFAPKDWAFCDGQMLAIQQNQALYSLLGTEFGGDGRTNFALPDFRGRAPVGIGTYSTAYTDFTYNNGTVGGQTEVTLNLNELPTHTHQFEGANTSAELSPPIQTPFLANSESSSDLYNNAVNLTQLSSTTSSSYGGGQSHSNLQPTSTVNFIISLAGLYPQRN